MGNLGLAFAAPLAEEDVVRIEVPISVEQAMTSEDKWDPEGWQTFLAWFKDNMLNDREEAGVDAKARQSRVGISFTDFNRVVYRLLGSKKGIPSITAWWEDNRPDPSEQFESENHVVFVSDISGFAWHLMPLSNGTSIGVNYSVSVQPREWECPSLSGHDACIYTTGNIKQKDSEYSLLGDGTLFNLATATRNTSEKNAFRHRGIASIGPENTAEEEIPVIFHSIINERVPLSQMTDLNCRIHGSNSTCLPSFWLHEGHGYAGSLQLHDETNIRAKQIGDYFANTEGTTDMAWLCSCHSVETVTESHMFVPENPKVRAFLGHLGMGDESASVVAFEHMVMGDIMNGHSIGNAVYRARRAMRPECSSGSYVLMGDPRIILCPKRQ
jgi:hypothetical protein